MKAIRVHQAGGPEVLQIEEIPRPQPRPGWVLIRVKAFGLNRSEMYTRQGFSPTVQFPRVLGIECVGTVEDAADTDFAPGQTVAALMGQMGRAYDGGYAEYTLVPAQQVIALNTHLSWETLAAIPETFLTARGSLIDAMDIKSGQTLLIRGATSSLGLAALSLAREKGVRVIATTRNPTRASLLQQKGAEHVVIDTGQIAEHVRGIVPGGVNGVLELVGATTLRDSLKAVAPRGIVCNSGILGNAWILDRFEPIVDIPSTVRLTVYTSDDISTSASAALQHIVEGVEQKRYDTHIDRIFHFHQIVEAHRYMEENHATGKLVVLVDE